MRSENIGSSPTTSGASSCWTIAATIGGEPSAAPIPVRPASVSTRIKVASLLTLVPRSVRWRLSGGTGADMGMAVTLVIFMSASPMTSLVSWPSERPCSSAEPGRRSNCAAQRRQYIEPLPGDSCAGSRIGAPQAALVRDKSDSAVRRRSADLLEIPLGVAEQSLTQRQPLVIVADGKLVGH